ncbi:DegT/DnrJ/EryC1/StrS aminotransferase family protein [Paucibacter sp. APW11]|uniref:DegT/DnrJ/EryC1/StrS aminotransferase family protein n=1 Tax=Roseateles aquae TaxID=3077235 RepID=A0ABU3PFD4_9BURK|nr:DegT/DnrJ/EryC1/StrS aminotransferase family protein [Paucibacter sp. APW11]MDT9001263.1 DegT/DnrJ/EryC1/StrS aminotransferase family protein [Paucibacter sp. APW11]
MSRFSIPIYQPELAGNEKLYVNECLDTSWISSRGRFVGEFETQFAKRIDVQHAASVCNGTVALHLALLALGIGPGDEVIVPTLTYIASVNAIAYTGATPIFVDSLLDTWQIDPEDVRRHISPRTRAIMPVHLYGQACDMEALMQIAQEHRLFVIEDCAEAFGTYYKGRHVGTFGDISTFSFFGNKTITTGEGGMVVSNDKTLIERSRHLKGQGLAAHREYWHDVVGYNYRMTNIQAAIGLAQLEQASRFIERKRAIAAQYATKLAKLPVQTHQEAAGTIHSYWMCSILVERAEQRDALRAHLADAGIETRPLFYPAHTMPMHSKNYRKHPVAEDLAWRGINLPSFPALTDAQIDTVCASIASFYQHGR